MNLGQILLMIPLGIIGIIMAGFMIIVVVFGLFALGLTSLSFAGVILNRFGFKFTYFRIGLFKYALNSLKERFTRSTLTIISITVGIMAIFALVSFGQGLTKYIDDIASEMGTDKLMIQPKGFSAPGSGSVSLSQDDMDYVRKINGIDEITGMKIGYVEASKDKDLKGKWVYGMSTPLNKKEMELFEQISTVKIGSGRNLREGDSKKVVMGYNYQVPDKIFKKPVKLRDKIYLNKVAFTVIGFYEEVGNPQDDSNIYMIPDDADELFGTKDEYYYLIARASPDNDPTALASEVEDRLRRHKGQKEGEEDFYVQTFEQAIATFTTVFNVLNGILLLIVMISVVVAAVNIINTMYTAVIERTHEIGIMKSIGSSNLNIMFVFIVEAGLQGLAGGIIGIILGYLIAKMGGAIAAAAGYSMLQPYFPPWLIIFCLAFSYLVGAGSGFFPAWQASKLKPVDALRYE